MSCSVGSCLSLFCIAGLLVIVGVSYYNLYITRWDNYGKHIYVYVTFCTPASIDPLIQINLMTFEGLPTNCSQSRIFVNTWPSIGAIGDLWEASPINPFSWFKNWYFKVGFFGTVVLILYGMAKEYMKGRNDLELLDRFHQLRELDYSGQIKERPQIEYVPWYAREQARNNTPINSERPVWNKLEAID